MSVVDDGRLEAIERYYDTVPRAFATVERIGPFTLFVGGDSGDQSYYARPFLEGRDRFTIEQVRRVRARQQLLGAPEAFEWVDEIAPALHDLATTAGLNVTRCSLMVLTREPSDARAPAPITIEPMTPDHPRLAEVNAAIGAGFGNRDVIDVNGSTRSLQDRLESGRFRLVGAFDGSGAIGGGSHSPRGQVTELTGIAVLPRARRQGVGAAITAALIGDAQMLGVDLVFLSAADTQAATLYSRLGFEDIATACIAEPAACMDEAEQGVATVVA